MAAISVTSTAIVPNSDAGTITIPAGETITAGKAVYKKASDGKAYLADSNLNLTTAAEAASVGVALNGASLNQPVNYIQTGSFTMNAGLTAGETYIVGAVAAGDINPVADKASTWRLVYLGYATTTTNFVMNVKDTTITL